MKKILFTLAIIASTALSYGQGTINIANSFVTKAKLDGSDVAVGAPINFGIFYGNSAGSLSMAPIMASVSANPGIIAAQSGSTTVYQLPGTASQQAGVFLQIRAWSSSFGSDWAAAQTAYAGGSGVWGETSVIQLNLGATAGPGTPIWSGAGSASTFSPIQIATAVPEPSTYALGALGIGALLMVRRRKA